ncbi:MAG: hypothetical protein NZ525_01935, partial [Rhodothermia bacterium]|nr:hypothetical protein [Rhodothermia bacterium]
MTARFANGSSERASSQIGKAHQIKEEGLMRKLFTVAALFAGLLASNAAWAQFELRVGSPTGSLVTAGTTISTTISLTAQTYYLIFTGSIPVNVAANPGISLGTNANLVIQGNGIVELANGAANDFIQVTVASRTITLNGTVQVQGDDPGDNFINGLGNSPNIVVRTGASVVFGSPYNAPYNVKANITGTNLITIYPESGAGPLALNLKGTGASYQIGGTLGSVNYFNGITIQGDVNAPITFFAPTTGTGTFTLSSRIEGNVTIPANQDMTIQGALSGTLNSRHNVEVTGNISITGTGKLDFFTITNPSVLSMVGSGGANLNIANIANSGTLHIRKAASGTAVTLGAGLTIPSVVTLRVSSQLTIGSNTLTVNGRLILDFFASNGTLGSLSISTGTLSIATAGTLRYEGDLPITAGVEWGGTTSHVIEVAMTGATGKVTIPTLSPKTINGTLRIVSGTLDAATNTITIGTGATLHLQGGTLDLSTSSAGVTISNGATLNIGDGVFAGPGTVTVPTAAPNTYNLTYSPTTSRTTSDREWPSAGRVNNLTISAGTAATVTLHADRTVLGSISIPSGTFNITGRTLTINNTSTGVTLVSVGTSTTLGQFSAGGTLRIAGSYSSATQTISMAVPSPAALRIYQFPALDIVPSVAASGSVTLNWQASTATTDVTAKIASINQNPTLGTSASFVQQFGETNQFRRVIVDGDVVVVQGEIRPASASVPGRGLNPPLGESLITIGGNLTVRAGARFSIDQDAANHTSRVDGNVTVERVGTTDGELILDAGTDQTNILEVRGNYNLQGVLTSLNDNDVIRLAGSALQTVQHRAASSAYFRSLVITNPVGIRAASDLTLHP